MGRAVRRHRSGRWPSFRESLGISPASIQAKDRGGDRRQPVLPMSEWSSVADVVQGRLGTRSEQQRDRLTAAERSSGSDRVEGLLRVFIDTTIQAPSEHSSPRASRRSTPTWRSDSIDEQARVVALRDTRNAPRRAATAPCAACHRRHGDRALSAPRRIAAACSTTTTSIDKTRDLLDRVEAAWVHYKLDLGIDHRADRRGAGHEPEAMG